MNETLNSLIKAICAYRLPDGGFSSQGSSTSRVDSTAWAALALIAAGAHEDFIATARAYLTTYQRDDGRVAVTRDAPQAIWPTPLAILAWQGADEHQTAKARAIEFLLATTGLQLEQNKEISAIDSMLKGWPWIQDTFSWVEPTVMCLMALESSGHGDHPRCQEARSLLLDRQLESGGWNFGNTIVLGKTFRPTTMYTGLALNGLAGKIPRDRIEKSIVYLREQVSTLNTPASLAWALLGLSAWGESPSATHAAIQRCLERQNPLFPYNTQQFSLLAVALRAEQGFLSCIET